MTEGVTLFGGVATTTQQEIVLDNLVPNNYLTIIWKDTKTGDVFNSLDIDDKQALEYTIALQNSIDQAISSGKISYPGQNKYINLESIDKYLSQNTISAGTKRNVVNALIGLASGSRTSLNDSTKSLIVNVFGDISNKVAKSFGLTDPHEVFSSFANENTIKLFSELGNKTQEYITDCISRFTNRNKDKITSNTEENKNKTYAGLIMGLTTSDTESMDITIPRKKVEDGSNYTTHLLPQPFKKEFNVILTNKVLTPDYNRTQEIKNIEFIKDKLIEIANSRTTFDIYIRLSNEVMYKRSNVVFSSLSFTKDEGSGNGYTASFTVEPITTFKVKTFISNKKYGTSGGKGAQGSNKGKNLTKDGGPIEVGWVDHSGSLKTMYFKSIKEMKDMAYKMQCYAVETPDAPDGLPYHFKTRDAFVGVTLLGKNKKMVTALIEDTTKLGSLQQKSWGLSSPYILKQDHKTSYTIDGYIKVGKQRYKVLK